MDTALVISVLALIATFYQLHLQRVHNEKSLKPLIQIDLTDRPNLLFVRVTNNGVGPVTIQRLRFKSENQIFHRMQDGISLDPRVYDHFDIDCGNKKVLTPGGHLDICYKAAERAEDKLVIDELRLQLAKFSVRVDGVDIYGNKMSAMQDLRWFARYETIHRTSV